MIKQNSIFTVAKDRSQIVSYNNPLFQCFSQEKYYPEEARYQVPEHWHEDLEYLYVKEGAYRCSVNGQSKTLHTGEGILINSKRIHSNGSIDGEHCIFYCVIFHPSAISCSRYIEEKYVLPVIGPGSFDYLLISENDWTREIAEIVSALFNTPADRQSELSVIEASLHILGLLHEKLNPQTFPAAPQLYEDTFKQMVTYIQTHFTEKISIDDIAAAGSIGKTLCTKIFKKFALKTPGEYLIHFRITESMPWLADQNRSITEIAYASGFTSASHYTETFRQLTGCTPKQFRKSHLNNDASLTL